MLNLTARDRTGHGGLAGAQGSYPYSTYAYEPGVSSLPPKPAAPIATIYQSTVKYCRAFSTSALYLSNKYEYTYTYTIPQPSSPPQENTPLNAPTHLLLLPIHLPPHLPPPLPQHHPPNPTPPLPPLPPPPRTRRFDPQPCGILGAFYHQYAGPSTCSCVWALDVGVGP